MSNSHRTRSCRSTRTRRSRVSSCSRITPFGTAITTCSCADAHWVNDAQAKACAFRTRSLRTHFGERNRAMTTVTQESAGTTSAAPSLATIKAKQQAMWASGDFAVIGTTLQIVGEELCEAVDVGGGERVLDVAAGNGNATLAAARRFAHVTSTDYVPALLDGGRRRAEAEGLAVTFEPADAEALPYPAASFDVVLSTFGVMFAPDHAQSASELRRVCRLGGRIGLVSWTPEGFLGDLFRTVAKYVPPPAGVQSPLLWGTRAHIQELFPDA